MCQFCHQHGEGKKWYLNANNYSEDLLSDLGRRKYMLEFIDSVGSGSSEKYEKNFRRAMKAPRWLRQLYYGVIEHKYRVDHYGQVIPIEDVERVFEISNSIVRMPCICRKSTTGSIDSAYCIGLGLNPEKLLDVRDSMLQTFRAGPGSKIFDTLTRQEALELHTGFERKGLIHTIWTFKTPFIGAICNCDRADCLAMLSYRYNLQLFYRGEYVGVIDQRECAGCKACFSMCQFGAIGHSVLTGKSFIDPLRCYGCGVCRISCEQRAITLMPRDQHPIAGTMW